MNYDSNKNQRILGKLVEREVMACISDMADALFGYQPDQYAEYEEFRNMVVTRCPKCAEVIDEPDDLETDDDFLYTCPMCGEKFEEMPRYQMQEIYEWWIVSSWLGEKLAEHGEPVLERTLGWIWGRCCTGQAILLDYVIGQIAEEMEILEGQQYEWKVI